jgi:hypothetical protein
LPRAISHVIADILGKELLLRSLKDEPHTLSNRSNVSVRIGKLDIKDTNLALLRPIETV